MKLERGINSSRSIYPAYISMECSELALLHRDRPGEGELGSISTQQTGFEF
jgi:hypothetical protein